ncbi:MAG: hypothetical protein AB8H47_07205 [Bacteroidia bacterium]
MFKYSDSLAPLPHLVRIASILLVVINLVGALVGTAFFWSGFPIPGLIAYGVLVSIAIDNRSQFAAKFVGILGLIYNLILAYWCIRFSRLSFEQWLYNDLTFSNPWGSLLTSFGYSIPLYCVILYSIFSPPSHFNPPILD